MDTDEIVLILFGNFNPITNMHLRMFEIAKDFLTDSGLRVHRGIVSPFEKDPAEKNLVSMEHRIAMIRSALSTSDWIQLSSGHCEKFDLPTISSSLQHHQSRLELLLRNNVGGRADSIEDNARTVVKLLCGADVFLCLLNSDAIDELHNILINHGIIVISRAGFDVDSIIYENDTFWTHRKNILTIKDQIENRISSTKIRRAISRGQSVKYLISDVVERYISENGLYLVPDDKYDDEYTLDSSKLDLHSSQEEAIDSFREFTWHSSQSYEHASSSDTLTNNTPSKKSQLSQTNRGRRGAHFRNVDQSKLIEIPLTEDGAIQIIADKETNL